MKLKIRAHGIILTMLLIFVGDHFCSAFADERFVFSGDFRHRLEIDYDVKRANGDLRDDRIRTRIRLRGQLEYQATDKIDVTLRARTGNTDNQQGNNVTYYDFSGGVEDDLDIVLSKWFVRYRDDDWFAWAGRGSLPGYYNNAYFYDPDVTMLGVAGGRDFKLSSNVTAKLIGGMFKTPSGMAAYSGELNMGQAQLTAEKGPSLFQATAGYYRYNGDPSDPDAGRLLEANGARDYSIATLNLLYKRSVLDRPFSLSLDIIENLEDYESDLSDPIAVSAADETSGFVFSTSYGDTKKKGNWQIGYRYADIDLLAINNSYAHDDLGRMATATQSRLSDIRGHDLRVAYALSPRMTLGARAMSFESKIDLEEMNRARIDLSIKF